MVDPHFYSIVFYGDDYPGAMRQCSNLRKLTVSSTSDSGGAEVTEKMIANVFEPSSFPKLEHLSLDDFTVNEQNMRLIASCTANLKYVCLLPFEWDSKANLNTIDMQIFSCRKPPLPAETALESLGALVKVFRKCRSLSLALPSSVEGEVPQEDLIHIAKALPCRERRVNLQIGDVHYVLYN